MEITLSEELMELLGQLVGVLTRVQFQYLLAIIPAAAIFFLYFFLNLKPLLCWAKRKWLLYSLGRERGNLVMNIVHHATPSSLLNIFKLSFLSLDDSQKVLQLLREYPDDKSVDLILHTPGGLVMAAEQIAKAIKRRKGETHVYIPQYAMSGGTLVALACSHIHMGKDAILGPLDPQLSIGFFEVYPAVSIIEAAKSANPHRDDKTLILADISRKAIDQLTDTTIGLLEDKMGRQRAEEVARILCQGKWTHDYGITTERALEIGLPVDNEMLPNAVKIIEAYPRESSVEYRKHKGKQDGQIRIQL